MHTARRATAAALLAVATLGPVAPAAAVDLGVFSGPARFEAGSGATLDLGERRYVGTVEARVAGGGLTVIDELSFDAYLEGLAEVPVRWPEAALEAQVIAARSYAWRSLRRGAHEAAGYDICATQACQVFAGRDVVEADPAGRWSRAVAATSGQVLLDAQGEPILARYSSSTGGRSMPNVEVFPEDGDFQYLQAVDDPHDEVSPFHRWQATFPRAVFDAILAKGETLSRAVPFATVEVVERPLDVDLVRVTGQDGTVVDVTTSEFRFFVSREAPRLDPDAYPPPRPDTGGRMPATLLSGQVAFTITDDAVVVDGRGFGHAVGMGQYGALGKAEAGFTARQIVEAYYGISPTVTEALPDTVRVGVLEDVADVSVTPDAPITVRVGDTVITERGLGTWRVRTNPDRTLRLEAPEGYGAPLVADPTGLARTEPWATEIVRLETVVNKHVELEVELRDQDGAVVTTTPAGIVGPGRHTVSWSLQGAEGSLLAPGSYSVALVAVDEELERAGAPATLTVREPRQLAAASALPVAAPSVSRVRSDPRQLALVAFAAALLGAAVTLLRRGHAASDDHTHQQR